MFTLLTKVTNYVIATIANVVIKVPYVHLALLLGERLQCFALPTYSNLLPSFHVTTLDKNMPVNTTAVKSCRSVKKQLNIRL
jgi:hypothetical protein